MEKLTGICLIFISLTLIIDHFPHLRIKWSSFSPPFSSLNNRGTYIYDLVTTASHPLPVCFSPGLSARSAIIGFDVLAMEITLGGLNLLLFTPALSSVLPPKDSYSSWWSLGFWAKAMLALLTPLFIINKPCPYSALFPMYHFPLLFVCRQPSYRNRIGHGSDHAVWWRECLGLQFVPQYWNPLELFS